MKVSTQRAIRDMQTEPLSDGSMKLLMDHGLELARTSDLDVIVHLSLEAGQSLCNSQWGTFLHTRKESRGGPFLVHKKTGESTHSRESVAFGQMESSFNKGMVHRANISDDPQFGLGGEMTWLRPSVGETRSFVSIPLRRASGELLGGLVFGHANPESFSAESQVLLENLAKHVTAAIERALAGDAAVVDPEIEMLRRKNDQMEARLRQALDAAQLGTWTWDRESDMLDLDERAAGLYRAEAHVPISRSLLRERLVLSEDQSITSNNLQRAVDRRELYYAEYRINAKDGGTRWLAASGMSTFSEGTDEVTGMVGTVQDITLRKTQEDALRQSEKLAATGRMAATIAHEINNPLEAVTNLIYLVKTDPTVPSVAQGLLETADQELARVAQIAQQTLGFYRDTTRPVQIDLGDLLKSVMSLFQRKLTYKKITYTLEVEPNLRIFGLQGELRQVFSNLIVNAIDASLLGGIRIRARRVISDGVAGVSVLVCDEGTGIPAEIRQRLFSPFFTTKVEIGTGLGLWVTRGIVEKQGGSISFRSRTTGPTGTVFRVFLRTTMQISSETTHEPKFLQ